MLFHSILVQIRNYGDIHTIVLMLVFHFLSVLSFTFFSNYVFTWELELVGRVFVKAEVLGNVVALGQVDLDVGSGVEGLRAVGAAVQSGR